MHFELLFFYLIKKGIKEIILNSKMQILSKAYRKKNASREESSEKCEVEFIYERV